MRRSALAFLCAVLAACGGALDIVEPKPDASADASAPPPEAGAPDAPSYDCPDASVPPTTLECTGLYADIASKALAPRARSYAPATPLWSDGAEKQRWIALPPGTTIDATDPN